MFERIILLFSGVLVLAVLAIFSPSMFASAQDTPTQSQVPTATPPPASSNSSDSDEEVYVYSLPDRGVAPEIQSLSWLNSDVPLRLEDLRGQVVLLEFWTFDCIRTLPYIEQWHQTYQDQGLVVIGIHYPEFNYERDLHNIAAAMARLNVSYAVGQDNDGLTWRAYNQRYWPTTYLIDKRGNMRYLRIGEGNYQQTEAAINDLLAETYVEDVPLVADATDEDGLRYLTTDVVLNVRNGAGIGNGQIGTILPGMAFVILDEEDGWYQIRYNDSLGYVSGEYVTVVE